PTLALGVAMILSNARVLPLAAPAYDVVDDYMVPIAIPLLLLRANIGRILRETGSLLGAFHIAALGTVIGAILAAVIFRSACDFVPEVTGIMTGSYIGGSVNLVAIRNTNAVAPEISNPLIVADNFSMAAMFAVLIVLSGGRVLRRHYPHPHSLAGDKVDSRGLTRQYWHRKDIGLLDLAQGL